MTNPDSFYQKYLRNEVLFDAIDDYFELWHVSSSNKTVYEFLGLTREQYFRWVDTDSL